MSHHRVAARMDASVAGLAGLAALRVIMSPACAGRPPMAQRAVGGATVVPSAGILASAAAGNKIAR
jgi:hypothetical protein